MIRKNGYLTLTTTVAVFGAIAGAAFADSTPGYYYRHETTTQQKTTSTPTSTMSDVDQEIADRNARAMALHDQAVVLAHKATATAQSGDKRGAARIAAQAQDLFVQAFAITHPAMYAHRTGQ